MPFKKGMTKPPTSGRKKGQQNRNTTTIKAAFKAAFDGLGGIEALMKWARDNPTDFYKQVTKLIPTELVGPDGGPIQLTQAQRNELHDKIMAFHPEAPQAEVSSVGKPH